VYNLHMVAFEHHCYLSQCSSSAYTVLRVTSQSYGDRQISGCQNSKTPEPIEEKFSVDDYIGDKFPMPKI